MPTKLMVVVPTITVSLLRKHQACEEGRAIMKKLFPEGFEITEKNILKAAEVYPFDVSDEAPSFDTVIGFVVDNFIPLTKSEKNKWVQVFVKIPSESEAVYQLKDTFANKKGYPSWNVEYSDIPDEQIQAAARKARITTAKAFIKFFFPPKKKARKKG